MLALLEYIKAPLAQANSLEEALKYLPMNFKKDFLVSYVHSRSRIKDPQLQESFSSFVNEAGYTPNNLSAKDVLSLQKDFPSLLQTVSYMCVKKEPNNSVYYDTKNTNDYWKKIQTVEDFSAVFDISQHINEKLCEAEFNLREVIRKRKEVHKLKTLGFIWLADSSEDLSQLYTHYFGKKFVCINERYYIGWAKALKDINMRYFVCEPQITGKS